NSEILVQEALAGAQACGAETELITIWDKDIRPCDGCLSCEKTGKCHIKDDVQVIYPKMIAADGIIWGTPVYFWSATAQAKMLIDRSYALYTNNNRLASKVGGVISVGASLGNVAVWNLFNTFFSVHHMLSTDFVYGYARNKGDIRKDKHAMQAARELGRQMVLIAERKFKYPEEYNVAIYRFVKRERGIDNCVGRDRFAD
ncbi:MAG: flavodoxin family protein, partial [Chloroflexi bacterium]|nr:flavodoxin family protein [Chloroflexota bacterium]